MDQLTTDIFFLDCQTTGMRPTTARLLELSFGKWDVHGELTFESHLLRLPEGGSIPYKITSITGIRTEDTLLGISEEDLLARFEAFLASFSSSPIAVIHYAQFERSFLEDFYLRLRGSKELPFTTLCSYQIAKKLYPNAPSRNIRGLAGYFGSSSTELKRAADHVKATSMVWKQISRELEGKGVKNLLEVQEWLKAESAPAPSRYEYRIDRMKRLELSENPGVYRMISKTGEVLYVGKATSLRSRVNSYFRGMKGRDRKKLEMLASVWDIETTECETALEAALLETDEIKRLDPPYNMSLKLRNRRLLFYSRDFSTFSETQTKECSLGPFRTSNQIENLKLLFQAKEDLSFENLFYEEVDPLVALEGFQLFCVANGLAIEEPISIRRALGLGLKLCKNFEEEEEDEDELEDIEEAEVPLTAEEVAKKIERMFLSAAEEYLKSKQLSRLLNSHVRWKWKGKWRELFVTNGRVRREKEEESPSLSLPWTGLSVGDFDRMSVLQSELKKGDFSINH